MHPVRTAREAAEQNARMPEYYVMRREKSMPATEAKRNEFRAKIQTPENIACAREYLKAGLQVQDPKTGLAGGKLWYGMGQVEQKLVELIGDRTDEAALTTALDDLRERALVWGDEAVRVTAETPSGLPWYPGQATIEVPDGAITSLEALDITLPTNWNARPVARDSQVVARQFLDAARARSENLVCGVRVPSVISTTDFNVLLDPQHKDKYKPCGWAVIPFLTLRGLAT